MGRKKGSLPAPFFVGKILLESEKYSILAVIQIVEVKGVLS